MRKILFVVVALSLAAFDTPVKDVKLQYTFKVGDQYEWIQTTNQKISQSLPGMNQEMETSMEGVTNLKVVELTSTGAKVEVAYAKLVSKTKTSMGEFTMDSEDETGNNESKAMRAIIGKKFYIFLNKKGTVEKIEGVENLWSDLSSLELDDATETNVKQTLEKIFGEDALKGILENALIVYPDNKVDKGDSWSHTTNAPMNFPIQTTNTWKLKDLNASTASLSAEGTITTTDKEKQVELPNGFKTTFDLSGTQNMTGSADVKTGWPSEIKLSSSVDGKMVLLAGGPVPNDMDIPMKISSESVYKFVKK